MQEGERKRIMQFDIDGYRVLKVLKESKTGAVILAEHKGLGARRIIKCLSEEHPDYEQLTREARIMQRFRSEAIPIIYDIKEENGYTFLIEEFLEGESLKNYLKRHIKISESEILDYSIQLSEILMYIHNPAHRVLHLDLKPENIIVSDHKMKLIDFGSAICHEETGRRQMIYGTPGFCAPEMLGDGDINCSTDIYILGKIFEYMLLFTPVVPTGYKKVVDRCTRNAKIQFTESSEVRDALLALRKKKRTGKYTEGIWFAVTGVPTGYHGSWFALTLARHLKKITEAKVLVLDCNSDSNLEQLEDSVPTRKSQEYSFEKDGVTIAKRVFSEDIKGWRGRGYDFIICDFGKGSCDAAEIYFEKKFLVGSLTPWTRAEWDAALSAAGYDRHTAVVITEGSRHYGSEKMDKCVVIENRTFRLSRKVTRCILKALK
ncbi:MAG: serine/threonine protein kinase [Lachnospiraceae bacterium]|nr:serine/threonine protein kinase [Lachnospiraceae bacterium]